MPAPNHVSVARVTGAYDYGTRVDWTDHRHILPVELLKHSDVFDINDRWISRALRRNPMARPRMWTIDPVGLGVELLLTTL